MSTITMSEAAHPALLMQVGVTRRRCSSRRTEKVPVGGGQQIVFVQHAAELHNRKPILAVTGHGNLAAMVQHVSESLQEQAVRASGDNGPVPALLIVIRSTSDCDLAHSHRATDCVI